MHLLSTYYYYTSLAIALQQLPTASAASSDTKPKPLPCTIRSPTSGAFFDLNPIHIEPPPEKGKKASKDARTESWTARGYDYGANFTLNFCGPVVEELKDVVGVEERLWANVSAYYEAGGKIYSIGQQNSEPVFRGRKLVLNYTDGSPCPASPSPHTIAHLPRAIIGDDDDDDDDSGHDRSKKPKHDDDEDSDDDDKTSLVPKPTPSSGATAPAPALRRKSTIISLLCSADPLAPPMTLSFVAASPDSCTYFFEARTSAACGGVEVAKQQLGPSGVFGVIVLIAVLVYLIGGCVYQRTVMHQRGWRQLPNYALWAGIASFVSDMFVIATSSCTRLLPARKNHYGGGGHDGEGYYGNGAGSGSGHSGNGLGRRGGGVGGRGETSDDENRLIDQLDEEWDD